MRVPEQTVEEALGHANRFSNADWQWLRYAADSDVLLLGYFARRECLAFHRPRYVRLPRCLRQPRFRIAEPRRVAGGFQHVEPDDTIVAINAEGCEYCVVCRGVTFVEGKRASAERSRQKAALRGANLRRADLRAADLGKADLRQADLREADLRFADLRGADLRGARLDRAVLRDAWLHRADLRGASLRNTDLTRLHLSGFLSAADLSDADLSGAALPYAYLRGVRMARARLEGADLRRAWLERANLRGAHLQGAVMGEVRLYAVDLREANLTGADLTGIHYDSRVRWPAGFAPPAPYWPRYERWPTIAKHRENLARLEQLEGVTVQWKRLALSHGIFRLEVLGLADGPAEIHCSGTTFLDLPARMTNARLRQATARQAEQTFILVPEQYRPSTADLAQTEELRRTYGDEEMLQLDQNVVTVECDEGCFAIVAQWHRLEPPEEASTLWLPGPDHPLWHLGRKDVRNWEPWSA
jgi:uncharacterized protein YjbI with pentapeptide repeats